MNGEHSPPMTLEFMNMQLEETARNTRNGVVTTGLISTLGATVAALEAVGVIDRLPNNVWTKAITYTGAVVLGANAVLKFKRSHQLHQDMNEAQQQLEAYTND